MGSDIGQYFARGFYGSLQRSDAISELPVFVRDGILSVADYDSTRVGVVVVVVVVVVYFFTMG